MEDSLAKTQEQALGASGRRLAVELYEGGDFRDRDHRYHRVSGRHLAVELYAGAATGGEA